MRLRQARVLHSYDSHVKFVAVSLATIRKFSTIAEREMRGQAIAISVSVAVPSSSRYTTP